MPRNSGRFGFSRVVWDHEIVGSDDEDSATPVASGSSGSEGSAMEIDSCQTHHPPLELDSRPSSHNSPTPPLSEVQSETEKARQIIGGIKLCKIWVEPLDKGQVCYQGESRFRILKMDWRRDAELRRLAATTCEKGVTHTGNDTTQAAQSGNHSPMLPSSQTSHSMKESSSPKTNADSSSTSMMNATRKGTHTNSTDSFRQWKHTDTLHVKKKSKKDSGEFIAAVPTIWSSHEALTCQMDGCGAHFTRQADCVRHMRTVHRRVNLVCRECGRSFSRLDSLRRHATAVHKGPGSMRVGHSSA